MVNLSAVVMRTVVQTILLTVVLQADQSQDDPVFVPKHDKSVLEHENDSQNINHSNNRTNLTLSKIDRTRGKRSTASYNIELLFVIDYAVFSWWENLTEQLGDDNTIDTINKYYGYIFQGISSRFVSIEKQPYRLSVSLVGVFIAQTESESLWTSSSIVDGDGGSVRAMVNSSEALEKFQIWLDDDNSVPKFDHAILFTGTNLTYAGNAGNTGLAFASSMCRNISNSSIVEEAFDFRTVIFAAQQIARSIGARDDMDNNDCLEFFNYIMAPKLRVPIRSFPTNRWKFSTCSVQFFTEYINNLNIDNLRCLEEFNNNETFLINNEVIQTLPGVAYTAKRQCQNRFGYNSGICRKRIGFNYGKICTGLPCTIPGDRGCGYILPAEGTPCGDKRYCYNGKCSMFDDAIQGSDTCTFGNQPGENCDYSVLNEPFLCYKESLRYKCCVSCDKVKMDVIGCEYGDRQSSCTRSDCVHGDDTYTSSTCCLTCYDMPSPLVSPPANMFTLFSTKQSTSTQTPTIPLSTQVYTIKSTSDFTEITTSAYSKLTPFIESTYASTNSDSKLFSSLTQITNDLQSSTTTAPTAKFTSSAYMELFQTTLGTTSSTQDKNMFPGVVVSRASTENPVDEHAETTVSTSSTVLANDHTNTFGSSTHNYEVLSQADKGTTYPPQMLTSSTDTRRSFTRYVTIRPTSRATPSPTTSAVPTEIETPACNKNTSTLEPGISSQERTFFRHLMKTMRQDQRHIKRTVHSVILDMYIEMSLVLQHMQESDLESVYREAAPRGSDTPSNDDENINNVLRPLWRKHHQNILAGVESSVRQMRYTVLKLVNKQLMAMR